jgi:hypothetical protein
MRPLCIEPTAVRIIREDLRLSPIASIRSVSMVNSGTDEFSPIRSGRLILHTPYKNVSSFERNAVRLLLADDNLPG